MTSGDGSGAVPPPWTSARGDTLFSTSGLALAVSQKIIFKSSSKMIKISGLAGKIGGGK